MQGQESELGLGASSLQKDTAALRIAFLDDDAEQADRISALLQSAGHNVYDPWQALDGVYTTPGDILE